MEQLGLGRSPFADGDGEAPVFADAAYKTQVNVAVQMLHASDRLLILRGEEGVGKSRFLVEMTASNVLELAMARVVATDTHSLGDICNRLLLGLGLAPETSGELRHMVGRLWEIGSNGRKPVLLLDNAQLLAPEVLAGLLQLWQLAGTEEKPFGLVLTVDHSFDARLEQLRRGLAAISEPHVINLYPLTEKQTAAYLQLHLQAAGDDGGLLDKRAQRQIYRSSQGVPARINAEAENLLAAKAGRGGLFKQGQKARGSGGRRSWIGAALMLLVAIGGGLYAGLYLTQLGEVAPTATPPAAATIAELPRFDEQPFGIAMPDRYSYRDRRTEGNAAPAKPAATATAEPTAAEAAAAAADKAASEAQRPAPPTPMLPVAKATQPPAAEPAPSEQPSTAAAQASATPTTAAADSGDAWLRSRPPGNYTIQLIAAHDRSTLVQYIANQSADRDFRAELALVHTIRDGKDWHLVVSGDYRSRESAQAALRGLPPAIRAARPWIRSFGSIQEVVVATAE